MNGRTFVDTNVLVYARDASERRKQPLATAWLEALWRTRKGRTSVQVLQEFYATVTRKLTPGMDPQAARADVRNLLAWAPVVTDGALLDEAFHTQDQHGLSWWDSLIVAAARRAGCSRLLSEDFQHGRVLDGIELVDPFQVAPPRET